MFRLRWTPTVCLLFASVLAVGQAANGKLQIHHINVGQADAAILITPQGETVLFDMGADMNRKECQSAVAYLDQLGVTQIDYMFVSHYHFDHIGCIPEVLKQFPLVNSAYDRGESYNGATFKKYVAAVGSHRKQAQVGTKLVLDAHTPNPVTMTVIAVNGQSPRGNVTTSNENDLSVGVLISFGAFREEISADLSGDNTEMYQDVETPVAKVVGPIDVYKVHHHCSSHSTNPAWLDATRPTVGVISTGNGNTYHHPAEECVTRLHEAALRRVYWTEQGAGAVPAAGMDVIAGDVRIEVAPGAAEYSVSYSGSKPETYPTKLAASGSVPTAKYAWSKRSSVYHDANCSDVKRIIPENLVESDTPPAGKAPARCVQEGP